MSLKFECFATEDFKKAMISVLKFEGLSEEDRLTFWRFQKKYQEEVQIFSTRYQEIAKKEQEEKNKILPEDTEKDKKIQEINKESMKKLSELLQCSSELTPLSYEIIKAAPISTLELDILSRVLIMPPVKV